MTSIQEALETTEIFKSISKVSLTAIASFSSLIKAEKGKHLFRDKEEVKNLYILIQGRASLYKLNSLGEKKVIFVYGAGSMLNEVMLQDLPSSINCEMLEHSLILSIPLQKFFHVMEKDSLLTKVVLESMALKIRRLYRQLKNTTNDLSGEKRLAAKLYKLSKDCGIPENGEIRIDMNLTITFLAEMLGSKRETVSRQLKRLVVMGLVVTNKNKFLIPDQEKLSEYFKTP